MSLMTFAPDTHHFAHDPEYAAGRADAYDDETSLTVDALHARAALYAEHANLLRALGYMDRIAELRREQTAVAAAETELAHTDLETTR